MLKSTQHHSCGRLLFLFYVSSDQQTTPSRSLRASYILTCSTLTVFVVYLSTTVIQGSCRFFCQSFIYTINTTHYWNCVFVVTSLCFSCLNLLPVVPNFSLLSATEFKLYVFVFVKIYIVMFNNSYDFRASHGRVDKVTDCRF